MKTKQTSEIKLGGICSTCGNENSIVNQCGCDPNNLPTRIVAPIPEHLRSERDRILRESSKPSADSGDHKASTTVWANHGEPQEIDGKHFGASTGKPILNALLGASESFSDVALQAEAETLNTETRETDDDGKITREEWRALALTRYSTMEHYRAQRDKLLMALKLARKWMPSSRCPTLSEEEAYQIIDTAIANASK